jgi:hypothetical protein
MLWRPAPARAPSPKNSVSLSRRLEECNGIVAPLKKRDGICYDYNNLAAKI